MKSFVQSEETKRGDFAVWFRLAVIAMVLFLSWQISRGQDEQPVSKDKSEDKQALTSADQPILLLPELPPVEAASPADVLAEAAEEKIAVEEAVPEAAQEPKPEQPETLSIPAAEPASEVNPSAPNSSEPAEEKKTPEKKTEQAASKKSAGSARQLLPLGHLGSVPLQGTPSPHLKNKVAPAGGLQPETLTIPAIEQTSAVVITDQEEAPAPRPKSERANKQPEKKQQNHQKSDSKHSGRKQSANQQNKKQNQKQLNAQKLKSQEPQEKAAEWTMLITPGVNTQSDSEGVSTLNTFKARSPKANQPAGKKSEPVYGEPEVEFLGPKTSEENTENALEQPAIQSRDLSDNRPAKSFRGGHSGADYQVIYNSIPYSRSEYLANPGYRHEATMEILFGEMRPTTIHRHDTPRRVYNHPLINELGQGPTYAGPLAWRYGMHRPWGGYWRAPGLAYAPGFYAPGYFPGYPISPRPW